jgi:hypothetical protein
MLFKGLVTGVLLTLPCLAAAQTPEPRLETGVFLTFVRLEEIGSTDHEVGTSTVGLGGRIGWRIFRHLDVDGELVVHPRAGVTGYRIQGFVGAKAGVRLGRVGLYAKVRPGFLYFEKDPFGVAAPGSSFLNPLWADALEPALDLGGTIEYDTPRGLVVRFDIGDTIVRYGTRTVFSSPVLPPRQAGGFITRNRQWSLGMGKRF